MLLSPTATWGAAKRLTFQASLRNSNIPISVDDYPVLHQAHPSREAQHGFSSWKLVCGESQALDTHEQVLASIFHQRSAGGSPAKAKPRDTDLSLQLFAKPACQVHTISQGSKGRSCPGDVSIAASFIAHPSIKCLICPQVAASYLPCVSIGQLRAGTTLPSWPFHLAPHVSICRLHLIC